MGIVKSKYEEGFLGAAGTVGAVGGNGKAGEYMRVMKEGGMVVTIL